tara:strand:- start:170 stop:460 length:291 start_codon:yes stop_codon:yes gene_type:complete
MLEFSADNMDQLEEECKLRAHEVSLATVKAIIAGCEADVDVVNIGFMKNLNMDITCERGGFIEALELNIPRCVELEEYELVIQANKWISKLKENGK